MHRHHLCTISLIGVVELSSLVVQLNCPMHRRSHFSCCRFKRWPILWWIHLIRYFFWVLSSFLALLGLCTSSMGPKVIRLTHLLVPWSCCHKITKITNYGLMGHVPCSAYGMCHHHQCYEQCYSFGNFKSHLCVLDPIVLKKKMNLLEIKEPLLCGTYNLWARNCF